MIARITVVDGALTQYPLAERVKGGWQNGVSFYPDGKVTSAVGPYSYVGGLIDYLGRLPSHITHVPVSEIQNVLAGRKPWRNAEQIADGEGSDE